MDDINTVGEHGSASIENLDPGNWDADDNIDDEANNDQEGATVDDASNPMIVLFQQLDMDVMWDHEVMNVMVSSTQDLYVWLKFKERKSLRRAMKLYSVRAHHNFNVYYNCARHKEYRCTKYGVRCMWRA